MECRSLPLIRWIIEWNQVYCWNPTVLNSVRFGMINRFAQALLCGKLYVSRARGRSFNGRQTRKALSEPSLLHSWTLNMATMSKPQRTKPTSRSQRLVLLCIVIFACLLLLSSVISTGKLGLPYQQTLIDYFVRSPRGKREHTLSEKYLYWGNRIDCPGKNCETCAGLGHQESSLRCALEEALFLNR